MAHAMQQQIPQPAGRQNLPHPARELKPDDK
jgi:hypothetical protein